MPALLHFLPSLEASAPLCGEPDALLFTLQPMQVTCKKCYTALEASASAVEARSVPQVSAAAMKEKSLLEAVVKAGKGSSWLVYHTHDARRSEPGFPDLVLVKPGKPVLFAELKTAKGKVTQAQQAWLMTLAQAEGVVACVWRPQDLEAVKRLLAS